MADLATNWTDNIGMQVNAAYLNALDTAVNTNTHAKPIADLYANLPAAAASNTGALYFCTDTDRTYYSNGTAWTLMRMGGFSTTVMADPPSTGLTNTSLGSATFTAFRGDRVLTVPSASGDNVRAEYQSLASPTNFTATGYIDANAFTRANLFAAGIMLRGSAGASVLVGPAYNTGVSGLMVAATKFNSDTSGAGYYGSAAAVTLPNWFRIRNDGTNYYCEYSFDGNFNWTSVFTGALSFTPTQIGWGASYSAGGTAVLRLRSFKITTP